jgi:L-cysteine desulfidase
MENINFDYIAVLKRELKPVMGCTEPAAAALAGAMAREILGIKPERIMVYASRDVIKNVMGVGIPHSTTTGLAAAVLLGVLYGDSTGGLNILSKIAPPDEAEMLEFSDDNKIVVNLATDVPSFHVQVLVTCSTKSASVTIAGEHDRVVEKTMDGQVVFKEKNEDKELKNLSDCIRDWTVQGIVRFITESDANELSFLLGMANTNMSIAQHGLENSYGLQVGRSMYPRSANECDSLEEAFAQAASLAASASDARMAGCAFPVVINSGSGNQGVTAMVPPLVLSSYLKSDAHTLARALALSNLVAIHLAQFKGRLSALCGAFTAAIGTCCAFVFLMGGTASQVEDAIQFMIANLTGVVCDGAKKTCALKIHSCVQSAAMTAQLVMQKRSLRENVGIVARDPSMTLKQLETLCHEGFEATDNTILSIMVPDTNLSRR